MILGMVGIKIKITKNSSGISTLILIKIFKYVINPFLGIFEQLAWNSWYLKFLGQLGLPGSSLRHSRVEAIPVGNCQTQEVMGLVFSQEDPTQKR